MRIFRLILFGLVIMACLPTIALAEGGPGGGEGLLFSNNVTAYRENQYDQNRVVISYSGAPSNAAYIEIEDIGRKVFYRLSPTTSGQIYITDNGRYSIRWFDSEGKKIAWITPIITSSIPSPSPLPYPIYDASTELVDSTAYYAAYRDEYRMDYQIPSGPVDKYVLEYVGVDTTGIYTRDYYDPPSGTHYLTCNGGIYTLYFYSGDNLVAKTSSHYVNGIVNPTCASYPDAGRIDDLNARYTPGSGLTWSALPGADHYEIWLDGSLIGTTTDPTYPATDGSYTIIAKDEYGQTIGQSDVTPYDNNPPGGCDVCAKLTELLTCPGWDDLMSDLTGAIRDALPPPPDWESIAETFAGAFISRLDRYLGPVPNPPSVGDLQDILPSMPDVDTTIPGSDLTVTVPSDYDDPLDFDLTTAPVIPVVDESAPIVILDPDAYIDADDPGVMVLPGDSRNTSGGIKTPDTITTPYPMPEPTAPDPPEDPDVPPLPEVPPADMPVPGSIGDDAAPIPDVKDNIIPIPTFPDY